VPFARWYRAAGAYPTGIYAIGKLLAKLLNGLHRLCELFALSLLFLVAYLLRFENRDELRERSGKGERHFGLVLR
jgi:hypothetical protein